MIAAASAQHYQDDFYHQQSQHQPNYHQYQTPTVIASYKPTVVKQIVQPTFVKKIVEHEAPANYEFNYDVHDPHTGDIKQQHEVAKEGSISGQYSLIDADGYRRIVEYTADDHHGFQANVRREPVEGHKFVQPVVVKKIVAQPAIAVQKYIASAPQYHSAPSYQYYSAPAPVKDTYITKPIVQKYVAPVVEKYVAPVVQSYAAQPQYYSSPVLKAGAPVKYSTADHSSHVSFHGPASQYHY